MTNRPQAGTSTAELLGHFLLQQSRRGFNYPNSRVEGPINKNNCTQTAFSTWSRQPPSQGAKSLRMMWIWPYMPNPSDAAVCVDVRGRFGSISTSSSTGGTSCSS